MRASLASTVRHRMSGGALQQLRREGFIPASISARGEATQHCSVPRQKLTEILSRYGASALIELQGTEEGGSVLVISRDIQRDAVSGKLLHVGFQRVSARDPITAEVRLTLLGQPQDVRTGTGTLEQVVSTVLVRAVPDRLPPSVEVDTSGMEIGSVLHLSALPVNAHYEIVTPPETVVAVLQTVRGAVAQEEKGETTIEQPGS